MEKQSTGASSLSSPNREEAPVLAVSFFRPNLRGNLRSVILLSVNHPDWKLQHAVNSPTNSPDEPPLKRGQSSQALPSEVRESSGLLRRERHCIALRLKNSRIIHACLASSVKWGIF